MGVVQSVITRWNEIFDFIIRYFKNSDVEDTELSVEELQEIENAIECEKDLIESDTIVVNKRSMLSKLYSMEQMIRNFENDFPEKYTYFSEKICQLKEEYTKGLDEYISCYNSGDITFEIDPDEDLKKITEVITLETEVKSFMEREFKYHLMSKRLQKLCLKLSILYNTSLLHFREYDKQNVILQASRAKEVLLDIVDDFKSTEMLKGDKLKKEYLLDLIFYADYLILKCNLRNSQGGTEEHLNNLVILKCISGVDHLSVIKDFVLEEILNLSELLNLLKEENYYFSLLNKVRKVQNDIDVSDNSFWENVFDVEDSVLNSIRLIGKDSIAKIALLERFDVEFDEREIYFSVKSQTCLALADIFFKTKNPNIGVVLKLMYELDDNVTYKEVYFVLLLFGLVDIVKSSKQVGGSFVSNIERLSQKYPYSSQKVEEKKRIAKNVENYKKKYVRILFADEYDMTILTKALEEGNFDFIVSGNAIYLNSFYFHELENVNKSLNDKKAYNEF